MWPTNSIWTRRIWRTSRILITPLIFFIKPCNLHFERLKTAERICSHQQCMCNSRAAPLTVLSLMVFFYPEEALAIFSGRKDNLVKDFNSKSPRKQPRERNKIRIQTSNDFASLFLKGVTTNHIRFTFTWWIKDTGDLHTQFESVHYGGHPDSWLLLCFRILIRLVISTSKDSGNGEENMFT